MLENSKTLFHRKEGSLPEPSSLVDVGSVAQHYKTLDFFARQVVEGFITGLHRSPFHGFSVEFAEHRLYNTGESTRNIDWKLYARTDKLFVKRFEEETNMRCHLVVDNSSSMLFPLQHHANLSQPNKLTFSVLAAATLVELFLRQRDAFGLTLFSDRVEQQTEVRSSLLHQQYLYSLLNQLLQPPPKEPQQKSTHLVEVLHSLAEQMHRRSMIILFSDAFVRPGCLDDFYDALRHLRHKKHEVILFHTIDNQHEIEFNFGTKPCCFVDMETGKRIKMFPKEYAAIYRENMHRRMSDIKAHAIQYQVDYLPVDVGQGFYQVLQPYLLKRSK